MIRGQHYVSQVQGKCRAAAKSRRYYDPATASSAIGKTGIRFPALAVFGSTCAGLQASTKQGHETWSSPSRILVFAIKDLATRWDGAKPAMTSE
jgi:hypothetical protein